MQYDLDYRTFDMYREAAMVRCCYTELSEPKTSLHILKSCEPPSAECCRPRWIGRREV